MVILSSLTMSIALMPNIIAGVPYGLAFAQQQRQSLQQNQSSNQSANNTYPTTFNVTGLIASWAQQNQSAVSKSNVSNNTNSVAVAVPIPYVISGFWNLQIENGKAKSFNANMNMVKGDGGDFHNHRIYNFKTSSSLLTKTLFISNTSKPNNTSTRSSASNLTSNTLAFRPNATLSIPGTADISTNDQASWSNVTMTLFVRQWHVLNIIVDANVTKDHFTEGHYTHAIYGVVYSIKDNKGHELLQNATTFVRSNAMQ